LKRARILLFPCLATALIGICHADDALVLPKGTGRVQIEGTFYFPIDKRYNRNGDTEPIAADYNTSLNSSVLSGLGLVDAGFGLAPGTASLGRSEVSFKWHFSEINIQPAYGVTDRLSIGMNIPYRWQRNSVAARVDASSATIGKNPLVPGGLAPLGFLGISDPLTTEDVQSLLGPGLQVGSNFIPGFGFKRLQTVSDQGLGDIEIGARYQYFNSERWRLAFTGGVRLPTGEVDNPDDLADRGFGTGATALLFRFHQDFIPFESGKPNSMGVLDPGGVVVNTTLRYDYYLHDRQELRVCSVHEPICSAKEKVGRDLGSVFEAEISGSYGMPIEGMSLSALYRYGHGAKDRYSGSQGFDYAGLAVETNYSEHVAKVALNYTTLPLYLRNQVPLPLTFSLTYRNRFAGTNNLLDSQYLALSVTAFF